MGIRFSKSNNSASHGTSNSSTTRRINTKVINRHSAPVALPTSSSNSIAIPWPNSQEINFEIEEYPHNSIKIHNQQHNLSDNSSLSSTNSACRCVIIKIQLAKMENNGNEMIQTTNNCSNGRSSSNNNNNNNNVFMDQSSNRLSELADRNANPIEVNVTLMRNNENDEAMHNARIDDVVACRTAGSFSTTPNTALIVHRHTIPSAELSDQLEQSTSKRIMSKCSELTYEHKDACIAEKDERTTTSNSPTSCSNSICTSSDPMQQVTQYVETSTMNRHGCRSSHSPRDSISPIAITAVSSDRSSSSSVNGSEQLSIWTPSSNEVIIQSQQIVVLCPQASRVTLSRVNENCVRGVVAAEVAGPVDNKPNSITTQSPNVLPSAPVPAPAPVPATTNRVIVHSQVDFVHHLVSDLDKITNSSFYWGKMDRYEAERLLEGKPEGTFLLRDSAQEEFLFSVTFRKFSRSLHARIEQSGHKFSFDCHDPCVFTASTVTGLLEHYKDPACVMFFEPMLTVPLHRTTPFSLQQLCRASIVSNITYDGINKLELPMRLKSYLKEYHYKQKLRTKPCEEEILTSI